jgi:hypothetical protein
MENMEGHANNTGGGTREKTLNPMTINDFLLTYMLLSPKPVVAVSKSITGVKSVLNDGPKAVEAYVLEIPWRREC